MVYAYIHHDVTITQYLFRVVLNSEDDADVLPTDVVISVIPALSLMLASKQIHEEYAQMVHATHALSRLHTSAGYRSEK